MFPSSNNDQLAVQTSVNANEGTWHASSTRTDDEELATFDVGDSLVYFLTNRLTEEENNTIRAGIEKMEEYFTKRIWYFTWKGSEDGTMDDVNRIARETSQTDRGPCVLFVDQQSLRDGTVLIIEYATDEQFHGLPVGDIRTCGRLSASMAPCAVVNDSIGNMDVIEYLESSLPEWKGSVLFHHPPLTDSSDDDEIILSGAEDASQEDLAAVGL